MNILPVTKNVSCDKKFLPVARNFLILLVERNFLLWQEISFCGKTFLQDENVCL